MLNIGSKNVSDSNELDFCLREENYSEARFFQLGYNYSVPLDKWNISDMADYVFVGDNDIDFEIQEHLE